MRSALLLLLAACATPPPPVALPAPPQVEGVWIGTRNGAGCYMLDLAADGSGHYVQLTAAGDDLLVMDLAWVLEEDALKIDLGDRWTLQGHASDALIYLDEYRRRRKYAPRFAFQRWDRWRAMERQASARIPGK